MLYVLSVAMQKGGVAKTTTAATLAQAAKSKGQKVLAVDLDPQGNLTFTLGANANKAGAFDMLELGTPAKEILQHCNGLDVIPAGKELATLSTSKGSATRLRRALQPIAKNYDFIVIDTPTREGEQLYNALLASNGLIIPTEADVYNLQSIYQTIDTAKAMQKANEHLEILGYILTKADNRTILARQMQDNLSKVGLPCLGQIRQGIAIKEAAALQVNIYDYAPKSKPAADYMALYEAITR